MGFFDNTAVVTTSCSACSSGSTMKSGMGMGGGMRTMMDMGGMYGNLATSGVDDNVRSVVQKAVGLGTDTIRDSTMTAVQFAKKIGMAEPVEAAEGIVMDTIQTLNAPLQDSISIVKGIVNIPNSLEMTAEDVVMFFQRMKMQ